MSEDYTIRKLLAYTDYETAESLAKTYEDIENCQEVCNHYINLFELPNVKRFSEIPTLIQQNLFNANIPLHLQLRFYDRTKFYTVIRNAAVSGNHEFVRHFDKTLDEEHKRDYEDYAYISGQKRIFPDLKWMFINGQHYDFSHIDSRFLSKLLPERFKVSLAANKFTSYIDTMAQNDKFEEALEKLPPDFYKTESRKLLVYRCLLRTKKKDLLTNPPAVLEKIPDWSLESFHKAIISADDFPFNLHSDEQVEFFRKEIEESKDKDLELAGPIITTLHALQCLEKILGEEKVKNAVAIFTNNMSATEQIEIYSKYRQHDISKYLFQFLMISHRMVSRQDRFLDYYNALKRLERNPVYDEKIELYVSIYNRSLPEECKIQTSAT